MNLQYIVDYAKTKRAVQGGVGRAITKNTANRWEGVRDRVPSIGRIFLLSLSPYSLCIYFPRRKKTCAIVFKRISMSKRKDLCFK